MRGVLAGVTMFTVDPRKVTVEMTGMGVPVLRYISRVPRVVCDLALSIVDLPALVCDFLEILTFLRIYISRFSAAPASRL